MPIAGTMRILIVEDDPETAAYVVEGLTERGHAVDLVEEGRGCLDLALDRGYDAMVVSRLLPGRGGLSIIRALREAGNRSPDQRGRCPSRPSAPEARQGLRPAFAAYGARRRLHAPRSAPNATGADHRWARRTGLRLLARPLSGCAKPLRSQPFALLDGHRLPTNKLRCAPRNEPRRPDRRDTEGERPYAYSGGRG
jgi:CheY-like chemotaxis protein